MTDLNSLFLLKNCKLACGYIKLMEELVAAENHSVWALNEASIHWEEVLLLELLFRLSFKADILRTEDEYRVEELAIKATEDHDLVSVRDLAAAHLTASFRQSHVHNLPLELAFG